MTHVIPLVATSLQADFCSKEEKSVDNFTVITTCCLIMNISAGFFVKKRRRLDLRNYGVCNYLGNSIA